MLLKVYKKCLKVLIFLITAGLFVNACERMPMSVYVLHSISVKLNRKTNKVNIIMRNSLKIITFMKVGFMAGLLNKTELVFS